jgi:hypothetical protein
MYDKLWFVVEFRNKFITPINDKLKFVVHFKEFLPAIPRDE